MHRLILLTFLVISLSAPVGRKEAYALTPSPPAATATLTPTSNPARCIGDCDGSGDVTIDELVLMVNMALDSAALNLCTAGDGDGNGAVTIDEIVQAVNAALGECPAPATPTATPAADGAFRCSAGPHDQAPCSSDDDCAPTGACVLSYGVCDGGSYDGFACDCPDGTCVSGSCQGGPFAGDACTDEAGNGNCSVGGVCAGTSHICLAGDFRAYPCLKNDDCTDDNGTAETCGATAEFCDGGDFDGSPCVDDTDCTGGGNGCIAPRFFRTETPTNTPAPTGTPSR
ncbi:MAG: hypothetical protein HY270_23885 [Deltaproteobacteria bacterium]|nr:hypothetical protein [Deltaproteobacteria bacterium]